MKTLIDGRQVADDSAEWRLECLARYVLAISTLADRRAWIHDFERRSGPLASAELMTAMQEVHAARRAA